MEYDATAKLVLDYINENKLPFRFGILVEDFPGNFQNVSLLDLTNQQRQMVMDHLWENYYSPRNLRRPGFPVERKTSNRRWSMDARRLVGGPRFYRPPV